MSDNPEVPVVTAQMLHHALNTADDERHGAEQAYMCHDVNTAELDDFLVDGRLNLVRAAEVLNATLAHQTPPATQPIATVGEECDLLRDANAWYSEGQVEEMERDSRGALACKCGSFPIPSGNGGRPDDGWRTMWCQGCMEHKTGWCDCEEAAVDIWNRQRTNELTTPPAATLHTPPPVATATVVNYEAVLFDVLEALKARHPDIAGHFARSTGGVRRDDILAIIRASTATPSAGDE